MAVSRRLRYEILRRDQNICHYCGATPPDVKLTVDHVVPTALGGSDDPTNLIAACSACNAGKSASSPDAPLVAAVDEKAAQFALAVNRVIEERIAKHADDEKILQSVDQIWCGWTQPPVERDSDWESSILRFHAAGVSQEYMRRAVNTAMSNKTVRTNKVWRYFCGICWNEVKAIQEEASKLIGHVADQSGPAQNLPAVPWASLAERLTSDLFYLITEIDDDGIGSDFYAGLSEAFYAGLEEMHAAYLVAEERGEDQIIAEDSAMDALTHENARYPHLIDGLRATFRQIQRDTGTV